MANTYKEVRKGTGYTQLAERVLVERAIAPLIAGAIGRGDVAKGEVLEVYVHEAATVQNYVAGVGVDLKADGSAYVQVNNLKEPTVNEVLDGLSVEQAYDKPDYIAARLEAAAEAIADKIDKDMFAYIGAIDPTVTADITSANVFGNILELKLALDKAKAPGEGRFLIVNPEVENAILGASNVILSTPTGDTILYDGYLGDFLGFKVLRTNRFNATAKTNMVALQTRAIVFADGWKVEPTLMDLNDSAHVGDSKIAARYAVNSGVVRPALVRVSKDAT